jgi:(S)-sulfolactate dehydrogenase
MRVIISELMAEAAVASLAGKYDTLYDRELVDRPKDLVAALAEADALIVRNRTQVNADLIKAAPRLKVVGRLGVGVDNIDVKTCKARAIEVIIASGANALAVAEYVMCTAMILLRSAYFSTAAVAGGEWPRSALSNGHEISGRTLGIVGFGSTGRRVAGLARALGVRVIGFDAHIAAGSRLWSENDVVPHTFAEVIASADIVTLHVPLTPATRNLVDASSIATMKHGAILINCARGGIVDERAVAAALTSGHLGGAAVDVFEVEPLFASTELAGCPNLILTPHIAGVTHESNVRVSTLIADKVASALAAHHI